MSEPGGRPAHDEPRIVFVFAGEGAHCRESDLTMVQRSPSYARCGVALSALGIDLEEAWDQCLRKKVRPRPLETFVNF